MSKVRHGRKSSRILCASLIEVEPVREAGFSMAGVVEDVSDRGLCISLDLEMEPGTQAILRESDRDFRATVRHCTMDEAGGYHIGFEFDTAYEWLDVDSWPLHRSPGL